MRACPPLFLVVASLLLAPIAGCGGGGDGSPDPAAAEGSTAAAKTWTGSKQAYVETVDQICLHRSRRIYWAIVDAISPASFIDAKTPEWKKAVKKVLTPKFEAEIRAIRALGFPSGEEDEVEAVLVAMEGQLKRAQSEPGAFFQESDPFSKSEGVAREYGFSLCGGVI